MNAMSYVTYHREQRIGYITINRPQKRNALNFEVVTELKKAFATAANDRDAKVIILMAKGEAFCAGADLRYLEKLQQNSFEENLADSTHLMELFNQIYTLPKVVIAAVQGHAIAGGSGLATVCDFTFAVPEAKFGYTEVHIGFIPAIVMVFLLRKLGEQKAKELLLTGKLIAAQYAAELGMISKVVENPLDYAEKQAQKLIENNSAQSMGKTKQMIAQIQGMELNQALKLAAEQNAKARDTTDCQKGIAAFLKKEKITW